MLPLRDTLEKMQKSLARLAHFVAKNLLTIVICIVAAGFLILGAMLLWAATLKIPDLQSLESRRIEQSLKIYDRTGTTVLYDLNQNAQRTIVPLAEISPNIQQAFVASEDPTFYENPGIQWSAIVRAVVIDLTSLGAVQGGSTITQQVVKQSILTNNKTITRKLQEIILALKLTRVMSKNDILELYLNQVPMGGKKYGVEAAANAFFGVPSSQITIPQAAYMAAILPAPTYYSPYGNHKNELDARKNVVLERMYLRGYIDAKTRDEAKAAAVTFLPPATGGIRAPHFVFYVEQYLEDKYGPDVLEQGGWKVTTTLDVDLQAHAEETLAKWVAVNETKFNATNAGLVATDPGTGHILAMVGSRDYFSEDIDGSYNVTIAHRQPGSTFKPFAYAAAFIEGYTPETVLFDLPTQFSTSCDPSETTNNTPPCYAPINYDNRWRGPMSLRNAIAQSINIPSIQVLYLAGVADTLRLARLMGITTLGDPRQYGLTLVLGGGEVTLLDMTQAYGTFAQNGMHYAPTPILKVEDEAGSVIEDNSEPTGTQVLPASVARQINDVLSDPVARAPLGGNNLFIFPGHDVAVKTGTTDNYRDAWTIGYTPNIAVGIWAGNNDNTPMIHQVSGFIVGPMWNEFMAYALTKTIATPFERTATYNAGIKPVLRGVWQGGDSTVVDGTNGLPATSDTPPQILQERVICDVHSILYWVDRSNPLGPSPREHSTDSQFQHWEVPVQLWAAQNGCTPGEPVLVGPAAPAILPQDQTETTTPETDSSEPDENENSDRNGREDRN
jgi:membrane peptidoglycan carboxypeptidase